MFKSYVINVSEQQMFFTSDVSFGKLMIAIIKTLGKAANYNEFCSLLQTNVTFDKVVKVTPGINQDVPTLKNYSAINILYKQKMILFADDKYSFMFSKNGKNHIALRANTNGYLKMYSSEFVGNGKVMDTLISSYFSGICTNDKEEKNTKKESDHANVISTKINNARAVLPSPVEAAKSQIDISLNMDAPKLVVPPVADIVDEYVVKTEQSAALMNELLSEKFTDTTSAN